MSKDLIKALFLDVGGVFLTNGWDHQTRDRTIKHFNLESDTEEINKRHALTFDTYEIGKITLDTYLERVIFYQPRSFSQEEFKEFMFHQSQPFLKMIDLICQIKQQYGLRTVVVSNEGKELTVYRIQSFKLKEFIDDFIFSCYVGLRKPDIAIYQLALNLTQLEPHEIIYIDDRLLLTEIGREMGMKTIHHLTFEKTQQELNTLLANCYSV